MSSTRPAAEEAAADRLADAQRRIEFAVAEIQSGDQWQSYLGLQSRLHAYSANNCLLISLAHHEAFNNGQVSTPWPTYVAGFRTWKVLGRCVDKGQHGYPILAPNRYTRRHAVDAEGHTRPLRQGADPEPGEQLESRQVLRGFHVEHVFAAEQTSGTPLPNPPRPCLLRGEAPEGLWDTIAAQIQTRGYQVRRVASAADLQGANGRTTWDQRLVEVRGDMDEAAQVKTLIHELGHVILHAPDEPATNAEDGRVWYRGAKEVEAESVAYIVADAHGLATDDYTFPYVSTWAGSDGILVVRASASRVSAAAKEIIAGSDVEHGLGDHVPGVDTLIQNRRVIRPLPSPDRLAQPGHTHPMGVA
jgi:hypothetical protein